MTTPDEAALMATARGRAFLQDYALRIRAADTATLLTAIGRIEGLLTSRALDPAALRHRFALADPALANYPIERVRGAFPALSREINGLPVGAHVGRTITELLPDLSPQVAADAAHVAHSGEPLMEVDAWLAPFRRFWSTHLDALERHLDRVDPTPQKKGKRR